MAVLLDADADTARQTFDVGHNSRGAVAVNH